MAAGSSKDPAVGAYAEHEYHQHGAALLRSVNKLVLTFQHLYIAAVSLAHLGTSLSPSQNKTQSW